MESQLVFGHELAQNMACLILAEATEFHHVLAGDSPMFLDVLKHHLLLLNAVKSGLVDIAGALSQMAVGFSAEASIYDYLNFQALKSLVDKLSRQIVLKYNSRRLNYTFTPESII
ncbi:MAG: hypothetical protein WBA99_18800 [Nodosilinea sp.]